MTVNKIVTLEEVKEYYGITGSKPEDETFIESLIQNIQVVFANYLDISSLFRTEYTEFVDGTGSKYLFLKNTPIISVSKVYEDSSWLWAADSEVDDFRVVDNSYLVSTSGWTLGDQNFKVVYFGGFVTIPEDIKLAAIEEIVKRFKNRTIFDLVSRNLPDGTASYVEKGMLKSTKEILNKYKNLRAF